MFLAKNQVMMLGVAGILFTLAMGITFNVNVGVLAQEENTSNEIADNFTDVLVPDANNEEAEVDLGGQPAVVATTTDLFLTEINATIAAISTLMASVIGIIVYVINAVRSKTGDKIISKDANDRIMDVLGIVQQKTRELTDVYGQFLEYKESVNAAMNIVKANNPELGSKIESALIVATDKTKNTVRPQVAEWNNQTDKLFETLQKKDPIGSEL